MSPLQIFRIFDYHQPNNGQSPSASTPSSANVRVASGANQTETENHFVERRKNLDRRASDRREKQQSTFLNTRKPHGRRQKSGRRATDTNGKLDYRPISWKG